jgi:hypothetical protein
MNTERQFIIKSILFFVSILVSLVLMGLINYLLVEYTDVFNNKTSLIVMLFVQPIFLFIFFIECLTFLRINILDRYKRGLK